MIRCCLFASFRLARGYFLDAQKGHIVALSAHIYGAEVAFINAEIISTLGFSAHGNNDHEVRG